MAFLLAVERTKEKEEEKVRGGGKEPCRIESRKARNQFLFNSIAPLREKYNLH